MLNVFFTNSLLEQLASHPDRTVRKLVTIHPNVSNVALSIVQFLSGKRDIPIAALEILVNDRSDKIRASLARTDNIPEYILDKLAGDRSLSVRIAVAKNPNTSSATLTKLARNIDKEVRIAVANNVNTSSEILAKLAGDRCIYVVQSAQKNLQNAQQLTNTNV